jgi:hypothetical protein
MGSGVRPKAEKTGRERGAKAMERAEALALADRLSKERLAEEQRSAAAGAVAGPHLYVFLAEERGGQVAYVRACDCGEPRIVFHGGKHGPHSLCIAVSDEGRVLAHWRGYVAAELVRGHVAPELVSLVERRP